MRPVSRRSWLLAWSTALSVALAGCGGGEPEPRVVRPTLPPDFAALLAGGSEEVAEQLDRGNPCAAQAQAQQLQREVVAGVNDGRVPPALQEELTAAVNALAAEIECTPPPPPPQADDDDEGRGNGKAKGKKKGKKGKDDD